VTSNDDYVLQLLQEKGLVTQKQVDAAAVSLRQEGETTVDVLLNMGLITEAVTLNLIAAQFGMELVHLDPATLNVTIRDIMPIETARKYGVVPLYKTGETLTLAVSDPMNYDTIDTLGYLLKCPIESVVASRADIHAALDVLYPQENDMQSLLGQMSSDDVDIAHILEGADGSVSDADAPVIKLVNMIIVDACNRLASDIHLEPMEKHFRVRFRIDGALHEIKSPPKKLQGAILQRIKIMAGMKISEKRIPQDGRIEIPFRGRSLDLRVSCIPTNHGESIVMRILDKQSLVLGLPELGFLLDDQQQFESLIKRPHGVLLVTGPTGSGKTTTLYACLGQINQPNRKIITVENPIEYLMTGVNQVQVLEDIGLTFSVALRSILRQAPNVVMIGEIRDKETADIAMEAALTGHLVFSTLHTNDAPSAVTRLLDLGVKPYMVASALQAAMAQRLVRCVCKMCGESHTMTEKERKMLGPLAKGLANAELRHGHGCPACSLSGYKGRKGIFEIFVVDDVIQRMIFDHQSAVGLRQRAREMGMRTLREDGLLKVASGMTTIEEVLKATMGDAD
jgi:type IV pilus assembly protein PilB